MKLFGKGIYFKAYQRVASHSLFRVDHPVPTWLIHNESMKYLLLHNFPKNIFSVSRASNEVAYNM